MGLYMYMKWMAATAADISDSLDRLTFCQTYSRTLTTQEYQTFVGLMNGIMQERQRPRPPMWRRDVRNMAP